MNIFRTRYLVPFFVLLLILFRFVGQIGHDRAPEDRFTVIRVIDGDTVELLGGDKLRLLGIDCPERGDPYYDSARVFLTSVILNKTPGVVFSGRRRDGYGRLLAYLYLDTLFLNREIVRNGLAYVYLFEDNMADSDQVEQLISAQEEAIDRGCGLWSIERSEEPYYVVRKGFLRVHRPGCPSLAGHDSSEFIKYYSRREAFKTGYSPCRICRP
jgi:micrococcal nuclease